MKTNIDKSNLRQVILDSPGQFQEGFKLAEKITPGENFQSVCVSGMGGSSLPTDALKTFLEDQKVSINVFQNRTYTLPPQAYKNCLNIFCSFSGNTEETIESFEEAIENNLPSVVIANGGKLEELAQKNNLPLVKLPFVIQPRYAIGYFFSTMLQILANARLVPDFSEKIIPEIKKLEDYVQASEEQGQSIAKKLAGQTPIIHASDKFKSVAMIWKIKINENAKTPAFWNYYPELSHNEMVGYTLPQTKFHILSLLDKDDNPKNLKRIKITAELLQKYGVQTSIIEMPEGNTFYKLFASLILGDWISYYLALEYGQDPTPVAMVEDLKKSLA